MPTGDFRCMNCGSYHCQGKCYFGTMVPIVTSIAGETHVAFGHPATVNDPTVSEIREQRIEAAVRQALSTEEMHHLQNFAIRAPCSHCDALFFKVRKAFAEGATS